MKLNIKILLIVLFVSIIYFIPNYVQAETNELFGYEIDEETNEVTLTYVNDKTIEEVIIPEKIDGHKVTKLSGTFYLCEKLKRIEIPSGIKELNGTFWQCTSLSEVKLPNTITTIESDTFRLCTNLKNIQLPDTITSIGDRTFSDCSRLTNITIPNSVVTIGDSVFLRCKSLENVTIGKNVSKIGKTLGNNIFSRLQ